MQLPLHAPTMAYGRDNHAPNIHTNMLCVCLALAFVPQLEAFRLSTEFRILQQLGKMSHLGLVAKLGQLNQIFSHSLLAKRENSSICSTACPLSYSPSWPQRP